MLFCRMTWNLFTLSCGKIKRYNTCETSRKAWFKRRVLHAPNQILILVDWNKYVRLI